MAAMGPGTINTKRAYAAPSAQDGMRILVDRIWPRGISKERLRADLWLKDVAPSNELRQWFGHDPTKWDEFKQRYQKELAGSAAFAQLQEIVKQKKRVTLLFGAADTEHNQAIALKEFLRN